MQKLNTTETSKSTQGLLKHGKEKRCYYDGKDKTINDKASKHKRTLTIINKRVKEQNKNDE
jgi:hypothetical protein